MSDHTKRKIEITLAGEAVQGGRVSVSLLAKILQSVQDVIYQIAGSNIRKDSKLKDIKSSIIKKECELFLVETKPGSLHAVMELPEKVATLFPELPDFSDFVMADTRETFYAIADRDDKKLKEIIPYPDIRQRVIGSIVNIAPAEGSDYQLEVSFDGEPQKPLTRPPKDTIAKLIDMPHVPLEVKEPEIKFVEAKGLAQMEQGIIKKWIEYYEIAELPLDMEHVWRTPVIKAKGKMFNLVHPIACVIEKQEDHFVIDDEGLGIFVYGGSREDVIQEFSYDFATLWDCIAQEEDSLLTQDAQTIKKKLLELVRKVESYDDAENA
ncbi:MAG: hypothetical protein NTZ24_10565 [Deltaproteobacteria bacterium]|nr:hypothetical protein [Deltaproteobacteria bacterium]